MSIVDKFDFSGKTVLVTGASSGIGRQTAISLSELGAKIVAVARREEQLEETISRLSGDGHRFYVYDLKNVEGIGELMKQIVSDNGPLDGLAYCAGISDTRPIQVSDFQYVESMMKTNFFAFYEMVRQFAKKGRFGKEAKIIGVSSTASTGSAKGQSIYGASKAAMEASVRVLARELVSKGININTVRPAWVKTDMYSKFVETWENGEELVMRSQMLGTIEPEDVAFLIAYLLSPSARYITGQEMYIGGGMLQ